MTVDRVVAAQMIADRLDSLAEIADLMGDVDGARRLHDRATSVRVDAMSLLDD